MPSSAGTATGYQGAYNIGTDGKDLVWMIGTDHPDAEGVYATKSIMTSPFTTDPAQLQPRRLRSDWNYGQIAPFVVGCGYAAHYSSASQTQRGLVIVRLSDGREWLLQDNVDHWEWQKAIGITCTDVYAEYWGEQADPTEVQVGNIARVALDSLGPGLPAD